MPIYEYNCEECGRIEVMQRITDEPHKECPFCRARGKHSSVKRLISLTSFRLKGSGWYKTDYANGTARSSGSSGESSDAKKADSSLDSKVEASAAGKSESDSGSTAAKAEKSETAGASASDSS